ncbi:zinc finger, CCHC-type containing protein [Tanacetum coccineum]|uniref:Zinc finger, CCHC-type containing protein n=1 Tax=Tanacetum coccineum TaxID=301880 RepID=A0ABQ5ANY3_9ASTR
MGDENPIRTLGDYSKPSHEGYRNTIELPVGNNVVPLRSDTIRLVQNGCSFYGLRSEDPNQHLKDFLKLVDSLDLDGENRERTRLRLFQFSLRDQASNWLERLPAGSISTWEDLTTRFLAQFFPPGRTAKLRNDILMFQQHHGESLSEAWTCFKDLLQKCEIDRAAGGKLRNKNTDESWEIIENLALYDHEGWDETKEFVKPVKAISTPQGVPKTPERRLLELEDQINFLLKSSSPQPQALGTTFKARVRDYMAAHTERMERFENTIFKQCEEINGRMTEMFGLLKELTTSRTPKKVLIREEVKFPVTKKVNSISLTKGEEEGSNRTKVTPDNVEKLIETKTETPVIEVEKINEVENEARNKSIKTSESEEAEEAPGSQPISYYLKHKINEKLIKGGPAYDAILKKNITKKEEIGGNFEIPCSIGNLKHVNAFVDQGFVLVMGKKRYKLHLEKGDGVQPMEVRNFKSNKHPTLIQPREECDDVGEVIFDEKMLGSLLGRYSAFGGKYTLTWLIWRRKRQDYGPTPTSLKNFYSEAGEGVTDYT